MAEELQFQSRMDNKRKYEDQTTPPSSFPRRSTGFSAPIVSQSPDSNQAPPPSYNNVPPPLDGFELAKQKAMEVAARINADAKRSRVDNGDEPNDFTQKPVEQQQIPSSQYDRTQSSALPVSYGFQGSSKKIDVPNGRVGVIIGKAGDTIKNLQLQSGAKIQVTRDMDADPNSLTRAVELVGTPEQISRAEELIKDVLAEAEAGGAGTVARRYAGQAGGEKFIMKVPNNKVGLIVGKGGETIKNMQARSGARIQVVPLHPPPGQTLMERNVHIEGTEEQIESAKQMVNEVISENRVRNPPMGGGYSQQGYRPQSWGQTGPPTMQQPGYGYVQPGAYPGQQPQYNNTSQPPYAGYPPQPTSGGFSSGWDQTSGAPNQQATQGGGYDYYNQQASQQPHGGPSATTDGSGYNYSQAPVSNYNQPQGSYGEANYSQPPTGQQQGYSDGYGGGYQVPAAQPTHGSLANPPAGYDQQGYSSAPAYGSAVNPTQDGAAASYGAQGGVTPVPPTQQVPPPVQPPAASQQGYASQQPNTTPTSYPLQGSAQPSYGVPPTSQPGYGSQPPAQTGYGQSPLAQPSYGPQGQKLPPTQGYPHSHPPSMPSGYAQPDSGPYRPPLTSYGSVGPQPGYAQQPYSAPPAAQPGYVQQPPQQPHTSSQPVQTGVVKASPPS